MVEHCTGHAGRDGMVEELIATVLSTVDMQLVLERTGTILLERFGETRVSIHRIVEDDPQLVEIVYAFDPRIPQEGVGRRIPMKDSVCGEAIRRRETVIVTELDAARPRYHEERFLAPLGYRALASFPLIVEDRVIGTLDIAHGVESDLLARCRRDAEQVAHLLAIALNNSLAVEEVRRLNRLLDRENTVLKREIQLAQGGRRYIAESPIMREVMRQVELVAASDATVLVRGETGTGKEGLARAIHDLGPRRKGPFVVVNLAAMPEQLIESELFGHEKGAFTGAIARREGFFEIAAGGSIFLDEIGDAPPQLQVRLLRALQEREIVRVGSTATIPVDVRVIAATNRSLERLLEEERFRSDLYYRLNIFPILLPPLRERREDIRPLVDYILDRDATTLHRARPSMDPSDLARLEAYDWPGNVRELENTIMRALVLTRGTWLELHGWPSSAATGSIVAARPTGPAVQTFDDAVRDLLASALERTGGRIYGPQGAAALLGLKPTTFQGKLRRFGVAVRGTRALRRPGP
jgi:formate hydrogenlyase transcriptional activator